MPHNTLQDWFNDMATSSNKTGRPFITLTYAQSLDGSITHRLGEPGLAISGMETKRLTHWLRTQHDAILVGIGTLESDNPKLLVTHAEGNPPRPVIVDSHLRTPPTARIFNHPKHPLIACRESELDTAKARALVAAGAEILAVKEKDERLDLGNMLTTMAQHDIRSVMVEGGAGVITTILREGLANIAILTIAPFFVGGLNAVTEYLPPMPRLKNVGMAQYGNDMVVWGAF